MANKFYAPGEQRAAKVNDLFGTIAPRYDLINDLQSFGLHRWWKHRLLKLGAPRSGERALDLCCGTGDVAFALARAGAETTGFDFSEPMLAVARERAAKISPSGIRTPKFFQGDAQQLPFADNSFDLVTISYGLRNLADFDRGLREMHRVTKAGGRLLVLDFGKPDHVLWRSIYFGYLRSFVPIFGKIFCGDSATHAYILESLQHYPAQLGVAAKMNDLNCADVRIINLLAGMMSINYGVKQQVA